MRIENLLDEVDSWCGLTKAFEPVVGYEPRGEALRAPLLAAVVAHGTNLGIAAMGHSAEGVAMSQLQNVSKWFLREDTIKTANAVLVWNTVQMERIVRQLRSSVERVPDEALAHVSPLLHAHVIPNGTYHFDRLTHVASWRGGENS